VTAVPQWLRDHPARVWDTEVSLPVVIGVGPIWPHPNGPGAWYGFVAVEGFPERLWECEHLHSSEAEAWVCAGLRLRAARVDVDPFEADQ
jgi:hypothetical protein